MVHFLKLFVMTNHMLRKKYTLWLHLPNGNVPNKSSYKIYELYNQYFRSPWIFGNRRLSVNEVSFVISYLRAVSRMYNELVIRDLPSRVEQLPRLLRHSNNCCRIIFSSTVFVVVSVFRAGLLIPYHLFSIFKINNKCGGLIGKVS